MQLVSTSDQLRDAVARVPRTSGACTTNFYASATQAAKWITARALRMYEDPKRAVLILHRDGGLDRLYHVAADLSALSTALATLSPTPEARTIVTDLIGKADPLNAVVHSHREHGFSIHTRLLRMQSTTPAQETQSANKGVESASEHDVPRIHQFLAERLDPLSEQVPDIQVIRDAVAARSILVALQGVELVGVLIYEIVGFTATLRYWQVDARSRDMGVGATLMRGFLQRCEGCRRILLWVIASNSDAISKYRHYGFREDGLTDDILVKQVETELR